MKVLIDNYVFDPALKKVTFSDYASISLNRVLLVTNVTDNIMIYNFASPMLGGTVSGNSLTLTYNTASMSSTDSLQIYYDNEETPSTEELAEAIYSLVTRLEFLQTVQGTAADLRVTPLSLPTLSTVTTVSTVSNIAAIGGFSANTEVKNFDNLTAITSNINNIAV
jgi:hypothetical protein